MGRDTTANKRMAAKRSREKAAGLRRLNVAVTPVVFDKLGELMKQHNCASQARLIELLVVECSTPSPHRKAKDMSNEVTVKRVKTKPKTASKKLQKTQNNPSTTKASKGKIKDLIVKKEVSSTQLSLFDS